MHADTAKRIDTNRCRADGTILGACPFTFLGSERHGDITHVRDGRLDSGRVTDPVVTPLTPCLITPLDEFFQAPFPDAFFQACRVIPGIQ